MRTHFIALFTSLLTLAGWLVIAGPVSAAPISMIQSLPETPSAAPAQPKERNWMTKWLIGDAPRQPVQQPIQQGAILTSGSGVFAYEAPVQQAAPSTAWPSTPITSLPVTTTPLTDVEASPSQSISDTTANAIAAAQFAEAAGDSDEARRLYYEYLTAHPTDVKALRELGHMEDRLGNLSHAEQHYRQALGADPASSAATNDLGLCLARQGQLESSVATFQQAIQMRPEKSLYRNNIATVHVQLGQADEALAHLKAVYTPSTATFNLGQLLARAGKNNEAADRFREALALEPNLAPACEALAKIQPTRLVEAPEAVTPEYVAAPAVATAPVTAVPTTPYVANQGVPSFPRLLPPVIER